MGMGVVKYVMSVFGYYVWINYIFFVSISVYMYNGGDGRNE